jgi:predicted ATPase/DNA-binding CsgD family transcriptional regulator
VSRSISPDQLNEREIDILGLLAKGYSNQQIAHELFLSLNTVKWYNRQIYSKLGVSNRIQLVAHFRALPRADQPDTVIESTAPFQPTAPSATTVNNLPAEITQFVGRKREIKEVQELLEKSRIVTVTGLPGTGKTRLALQIAREQAAAFRDGVFFVPLAPVRAADNILWAITEHLQFRFESQVEPLAQLLIFLRDKHYLLVLDNFDHLISGGSLLTEILRAAPAVKLLVTSRERLRLYGEVCYVLAGLGLPDESRVGESCQSEAVELFIERAHSVSPDMDWSHENLQHAIRICRLVDGMPLGIELAATWVDTLLPQEIADEIDHNLDILEAEHQDVPQSQRSIRAAFDRSWNLLDETQETAFRRLSVFRGGFTREAGETVAGIDLRTLQALVNKSLLRHNPVTGRYEIHELLRHYSQEKLERSGEAEIISRAHASYFADFMAERWPWMKDRRQKVALQEIEADIENARAAWDYWVKAGDAAQLKKFLHSFWAVYDIRGWYPAGIELLESGAVVMRAAEAEEARSVLGWLLAVQGFFSVAGGIRSSADSPAPSWMAAYGLYFVRGGADIQLAFTLAKDGIQILKRLDNQDEMMIIPLICLFITACLLDEEGAPLRIAQECLAAATKIGDAWAIAKAKQFLAVRAIEDGDYENASRLAREALATFEASGDHWSSSVVCIEVLGLLAINQRQYATAKSWIQQGLEDAEEIGSKFSIQTAYWQLGFMAALQEDYQGAGLYWRKALGVANGMLGSPSTIGFGGSSKGVERAGRKISKD